MQVDYAALLRKALVKGLLKTCGQLIPNVQVKSALDDADKVRTLICLMQTRYVLLSGYYRQGMYSNLSNADKVGTQICPMQTKYVLLSV